MPATKNKSPTIIITFWSKSCARAQKTTHHDKTHLSLVSFRIWEKKIVLRFQTKSSFSRDSLTMNLRKQQMHLQLQQQQQTQPYKRQNNRTGFEALLDQPTVQPATAEKSLSPGGGGTAWSPDVSAAWSPGGGTAWSPAAADTAGRYRHHHIHHNHHDHQSGPAAEPENGRWPTRKSSDAATPDGIGFVDGDATAAATTPPPPSPLSLPSPYYDRNPIVGFPQHNHHHQHHHAPKSPVTVPLANVQNVVHAGADQDHHDHYANNSKVRSRLYFAINRLDVILNCFQNILSEFSFWKIHLCA